MTCGRFEMAVPRSLSLVCFRLKTRDDEQLKELLDKVKVWVKPGWG